MKATLPSLLTLALAGCLLWPEPAAAAPATTNATATTATFRIGGSRNARSTRKGKKFRARGHKSSAARAHAKRNRRASF